MRKTKQTTATEQPTLSTEATVEATVEAIVEDTVSTKDTKEKYNTKMVDYNSANDMFDIENGDPLSPLKRQKELAGMVKPNSILVPNGTVMEGGKVISTGIRDKTGSKIFALEKANKIKFVKYIQIEAE